MKLLEGCEKRLLAMGFVGIMDNLESWQLIRQTMRNLMAHYNDGLVDAFYLAIGFHTKPEIKIVSHHLALMKRQ